MLVLVFWCRRQHIGNPIEAAFDIGDVSPKLAFLQPISILGFPDIARPHVSIDPVVVAYGDGTNTHGIFRGGILV